MTERKYLRSVSQLKGITRCGEEFALSRGFRGFRPPPRPAPWAGLGIAFHSAFQQWEENDRTEDVVSLFESYYDSWIEESKEAQPNLDLWILPPNTKSTLKAIDTYRRRGVKKDVPNYRDRCLEADWEILRLCSGKAIELPFEVDLSGVVVKGFIDRLIDWPGYGVVIEDLKTGSPEDDLDARQLDLYALAAREVYGVDVDFGRFWYTKLDRPGAWKAMDKTRKKLVEDYRKVNAIIDQKLFLPAPGKKCGLCQVRPWCPEVGYLQPGEEWRKE